MYKIFILLFIIITSISSIILFFKYFHIGIGVFISSMLFDYGLTESISISKVLGLALVFVFILRIILSKEYSIVINLQFFFIILFLCWSIFSLFYAQDFGMGISKIIMLSQIIFTYLILIKSVHNFDQFKMIIKTIFLIGILIGLFSVIGFYLNLSFLIEEGYSSKRFLGTGTDPNMFAQNFLILIPISVYYSINRHKIFLLATLCFSYVIAITYSRGALLALVFVLLFSLKKLLEKSSNKIIYILLFVLLVGAGIFSIIGDEYWSQRLSKDGSANVRVELLEIAIDMGVNNFFTGVGIGQFPLYSHAYGDARYYGRASHNAYLEIFATLGMPGLLILMTIIFISISYYFMGMKMMSSPHNDNKSLIQFLLLSFLCYLITGFFLDLVFQKLFWVLLSFGYISYNISNSDFKPSKQDNKIRYRFL